MIVRRAWICTRAWVCTVATLLGGGCDWPNVPSEKAVHSRWSDSAAMVSATTNYEAQVDVESLIGLRHPPLPPGFDDLAGSVIREPGDRGSLLPWVLSSVRVRGRPILLLSRSVERRSQPIVGRDGRTIGTSSYPILEVADAILLPPLEYGERLVLSRCGGAGEGHAIAYARWYIEERAWGTVRKAWQADVPRGELQVIDPGLVRCRSQ